MNNSLFYNRSITLAVMIFVVSIVLSCAGPSGQSQTVFKQLTTDRLPQVYSGSIYFSEEASAHADLELYSDYTFLLLRRINNDTIWNGTFGQWRSDSAGVLFLDGGRDAQLNLRLLESSLLILNSEGEEVDGHEQFVLQQINESTLMNRRFVTEGEYFYMADAAIMKFCATGAKAWPVSMAGDNLQAEKLFLQESSSRPGQKVFVKGVISVRLDSGMEGGPRPHIFIHTLLGGSWKSDCY